MDVCFDIYVTNGQNKQTMQIYAIFSKNYSKKLLKNLEYENMLYNSTERIVDWTSR